MAFYPFPRYHSSSATAVPCSAAATAPPPPQPAQPAQPPPTAWPPHSARAPPRSASVPAGTREEPLDNEGDDGYELVFNDALLGGFAGMEARRGGHRQPMAPATSLPQREDEASRAALHEARRQRQEQELRYGSRTANVRGLEAALNEAFDRVSRVHAPVLWPSVALHGSAEA